MGLMRPSCRQTLESLAELLFLLLAGFIPASGLPVSAKASETSLYLYADYGGPVAGGEEFFYDGSNTTFTTYDDQYASTNGPQNLIYVTIGSAYQVTAAWNIWLSVPSSQPLGTGFYSNAVPLNSSDGVTPGLEINRYDEDQFTYCGSMTGNFQIVQINSYTNSNLTSLWVKFEESCNGIQPGFWGDLRINVTPAVTITAPRTLTVVRDENLTFMATAIATNGGPVTLTCTNLPNGAVFTDNGNGTATISWIPTWGQIGRTTLTIIATDSQGEWNDYPVMIAVIPQNGVNSLSVDGQPPLLFTSADGDFTAYKTYQRIVVVDFSAPSGTNFNLQFSGPNGNLATGTYPAATGGAGYTAGALLTVTEDGDYCGAVAGSFTVKQLVRGFVNNDGYTNADILAFWASFDQNSGCSLVGDIKFNADAPVTLQAPVTNGVIAGDLLTFTVTATDINSNIDTLTATGLPDGATFQDNGDNTGTFLWTPDATQVGQFSVGFRAENGNDEFDTATTSLLVSSAALSLYSVQEDEGFFQTGSGPPLQFPGSYTFGFDAFVDMPTNGTVNSVTVQPPSGATQSLTLSSNGLGFNFSQLYTNQSTLDAAFANGWYSFSVDTAQGSGTVGLTLDLPTNTFPNPPHLNNWDVAQNVNPQEPLVLTWDAFVGGRTNDLVQLVIWGDTAQTNAVFATPDFDEQRGLDGGATAAEIRPNTLQADHEYFGQLVFGRVTQKDTVSYPLATGFAGYLSITGFYLKTMFAPHKGAGSVQFSSANYIVNNNVGAATISLIRTGGNTVPVTVSYATADGTAHAGTDYNSVSGILDFANGVNSLLFSVPILAGTTNSSPKTVKLLLGKPGHRPTHKATLQILED